MKIDERFKEITQVVDISDVMNFFINEYKSKKGKIIKREWYFDSAKGKVVFILTTDLDAPKDK